MTTRQQEPRDTTVVGDSTADTSRIASTAVPLAADPPVRPAPWHAAAIAGAVSLLVAVIATWLWRRMRAGRPDGPTR